MVRSTTNRRMLVQIDIYVWSNDEASKTRKICVCGHINKGSIELVWSTIMINWCLLLVWGIVIVVDQPILYIGLQAQALLKIKAKGFLFLNVDRGLFIEPTWFHLFGPIVWKVIVGALKVGMPHVACCQFWHWCEALDLSNYCLHWPILP